MEKESTRPPYHMINIIHALHVADGTPFEKEFFEGRLLIF